MATQQVVFNASRTRFLRTTLQADGIAELLVGAVCILGAVPLVTLLGAGTPVMMIAAGVMLLLYGVWLLSIAHEPLNLRSATAAMIINEVAAVAIVPLFFLPVFSISGKLMLAAVMLMCGTFAALQFLGIRQAK